MRRPALGLVLRLTMVGNTIGAARLHYLPVSLWYLATLTCRSRVHIAFMARTPVLGIRLVHRARAQTCPSHDDRPGRSSCEDRFVEKKTLIRPGDKVGLTERP